MCVCCSHMFSILILPVFAYQTKFKQKMMFPLSFCVTSSISVIGRPRVSHHRTCLRENITLLCTGPHMFHFSLSYFLSSEGPEGWIQTGPVHTRACMGGHDRFIGLGTCHMSKLTDVLFHHDRHPCTS